MQVSKARKEWKREYLLIILLFQLHKITVISRPTVTLSNFIVSNYSHELLVYFYSAVLRALPTLIYQITALGPFILLIQY